MRRCGRRAVVGALVGAVAAAACSSTAPPTPQATARVASTSAGGSGGRWRVLRSHFAVPPPVRYANPLRVAVVGGRDGAWVAFGGGGRGGAAWWSRDAATWQLASTPPNISVAALTNANGRLLAAGSVDAADGSVTHPAVFVSRDDGRSWSLLAALPTDGDAPGSALAVASIGSRLVIVGGARRGTAFEYAPTAWFSDDLVAFRRASVPGDATPARQQYGLSSVVAVGTELVAVGGGVPGSVWTSSDRGATWRAASRGLTTIAQAPMLAAAGNVAVAVEARADRPDFLIDEPHAQLAWFTTAVGDWRATPADAGQFGDGGFGTVAFGSLGATAVAVAGVVDRADPAFCYDDLATCRQRRQVILETRDGRHWERARDFPAAPDGSIAGAAVAPGHVLVVGNARGPTPAGTLPDTVWLWTGARGHAPAARHEPTPHPKPSPHALLTRYDAALEDGRTYRFQVPIGGGCGGGYLDFDGRTWKVDADWGEAPFPKAWPTRHDAVMDAPTDYLYATVRKVGDRIDVGTEGGPVLRTYHVTPVRPAPCA